MSGLDAGFIETSTLTRDAVPESKAIDSGKARIGWPANQAE
jgi:hypothetical protein